MIDRRISWRGEAARRGMLAIGLLALLAGCNVREKVRETRLYQKVYRRTHLVQPPSSPPGRLAALGRDTITAECAHESYANASKGLIVGEAGLHEDVFALRDRDSLEANAYELREAQRLEIMLRAEATAAGHSAEQADCIDEFAEHLEGLTDALVERDQMRKEMDVSAYNDAKKQAERQLEEQKRLIEQSPPANPPVPH